MAMRNLWTQEEMMLALNLYLKLPFGKLDRKTPEVVHLANIIGPTPNAVALRLVNFTAYDPILIQRGISGMAHGGKPCKQFWDEFSADREKVMYESERTFGAYHTEEIPCESSIPRMASRLCLSEGVGMKGHVITEEQQATIPTPFLPLLQPTRKAKRHVRKH